MPRSLQRRRELYREDVVFRARARAYNHWWRCGDPQGRSWPEVKREVMQSARLDAFILKAFRRGFDTFRIAKITHHDESEIARRLDALLNDIATLQGKAA